MSNFFLNKQLLFYILLLTTTPLLADSYFCWDNEEGIREYGNYVPLQYSQKGFWKMEESGVLRYVDPAPTVEEIAEIERKKEEAFQRQQQEEKDQELRKLFGNEQEIDLARETELNSIDGRIKSIETILEGQQTDLKEREESLENNREKPSFSEDQLKVLTMDIESIKKRIYNTKETLQTKFLERKDIEKKYDTFKERYRDIMHRRGIVPQQ